MTNAASGGKGLFDLHLNITVHHRRNWGQNYPGRSLEAAADAEAMKESRLYWLVSNDFFSLFCYRTPNLQPRIGPTHNEPGTPQSITN